MDDKFRLVFVWTNRTPTADDYLGADAAVFDTLRDAVIAAQDEAELTHLPFIAHRHMVFDSPMIAVLHDAFVAGPAPVPPA